MINRPWVLTVRVTTAEYEALIKICARAGVNRADMLRAMIVDALADEMENELRRQQSTGYQGSAEESEGCRPAT